MKKICLAVLCLLLVSFMPFAHAQEVKLPVGVVFNVPDSWNIMSEDYKNASIDMLEEKMSLAGQVVYLFGAGSKDGVLHFNVMMEVNPNAKLSTQDALENPAVVSGIELGMVPTVVDGLKKIGFSEFKNEPARMEKIWGQKAFVLDIISGMPEMQLQMYINQYLIFKDGHVLTFTFMTTKQEETAELLQIKESITFTDEFSL